MKRLIFLLAVSLLFLFPQLSYAVGGVEGVGAPLPRGRVGGDTFIRYIGDRLTLDFHEGSGTTVRDLSGNGNHGTFGAGAAAPTWERNRLSFDGGDYIGLFPSLNFSAPMSIEAYVSLQAAGSYPMVFSRKSVIELRYSSNTKQPEFLSFGGVSAGSPDAVLLDREYLLLGTHDKTTARIFVDGVEKNSQVGASGGVTSFEIGRREDGGLNLTGSISFIRINTVAFSAPQVLAEYLWNKWRN